MERSNMLIQVNAFKQKSLVLGIALVASPAINAQSQGDLEEIIVTGSYIRGSATDALSYSDYWP